MKYEYLNDRVFLKKIDELKVKEYFSKIILIDQNENEIGEQTDSIISGNINIDGNSTIRRTCNLSVAINEQLGDIEDARSIFSIGTKLKIEVGIKNTTSFYPNFDIVWFPVGIYVICDASASYSNSGYTIDLQLKDKMCLLNGECGGTLPASVTFDKEESYDSSTDTIVTKRPTIYQLINEIVNHWGGEQLGNIIVNDIDEKIKRVVSIVKQDTLYKCKYKEKYPTYYNSEQMMSYFAELNLIDTSIETDTTITRKILGQDAFCQAIVTNMENYYSGKGLKKSLTTELNNYLKDIDDFFKEKATENPAFLQVDNISTELDFDHLLAYYCLCEQITENKNIIFKIDKNKLSNEKNFKTALNQLLNTIFYNYVLFLLPFQEVFSSTTLVADAFIKLLQNDLIPSVIQDNNSRIFLANYAWEKKGGLQDTLAKYLNTNVEGSPLQVNEATLTKKVNTLRKNLFTRVDDVYNMLKDHVNAGDDVTNLFKPENHELLDDTEIAKIINNVLDTKTKKIKKIMQKNIVNFVCSFDDLQLTTEQLNKWNSAAIENYQSWTTNSIILGTKDFEIEQDVGYEYVDFVYNQDLIIDAGGTVCDALDKIKNYLGNYEYFYDEEGHFVFQEIKNYINTSLSSIAEETGNYNELFSNPQGYKYEFNNSNIIASYTKAPQYNLIKNDFLIWGIKDGSSSDSKIPIRYHLAIDEKPTFDMSFLKNKAIFVDTEDFGFNPNRELNIRVPKRNSQGNYYNTVEDQTQMYNNNLDKDMIYKIETFKGWFELTDQQKSIHGNYFSYIPEKNVTFTETYPLYFIWDKDIKKWLHYSTGRFYYFTTDKNPELDRNYCILSNDGADLDWRTQIYLFGLFDETPSGFDNYYYTELVNEWSKIYEFKKTSDNDDFNTMIISIKEEAKETPTTLSYFIDLISSTSELNQFSVQNIGRRTKVINEDDINCIFEPDIKDIYYIRSDDPDIEKIIKKCGEAPYFIISGDIFDTYFSTGGTFNSAYNQARNLLLQSTKYNTSITMTTLPIYYLDVNSKIFVSEEQAHINDQYMISNISYSLDGNATMTISATQLIDSL